MVAAGARTKEEVAATLTARPEAIEERKEAFEEVTGAGALSAELKEKRLEQPSIEPEGLPLAGRAAELGLKPATIFGNLIGQRLETAGVIEGFTPQTSKELAESTFGKALGLSTLAASVAVAATLAGPPAAAMAAGVASKSVFAAGALGTAVTAVSGYFGVKQVLDYKGGELETMRGILSQYTEDGEKIKALASLGADLVTELEILHTYAEEVDYAEATIQQIGIDNIQFRYEKEWIQDMGDIRTARTAIQRRVDELNEIAGRGTITIDPTSLVYTIDQAEKTHRK